MLEQYLTVPLTRLLVYERTKLLQYASVYSPYHPLPYPTSSSTRQDGFQPLPPTINQPQWQPENNPLNLPLTFLNPRRFHRLPPILCFLLSYISLFPPRKKLSFNPCYLFLLFRSNGKS